jgi:hypothetical protein
MERFTLEIEMGNDSMQTGGDIADALRKIADDCDTRRGGKDESGRIRDENGNTVGHWEINPLTPVDSINLGIALADENDRYSDASIVDEIGGF